MLFAHGWGVLSFASIEPFFGKIIFHFVELIPVLGQTFVYDMSLFSSVSPIVPIFVASLNSPLWFFGIIIESNFV